MKIKKIIPIFFTLLLLLTLLNLSYVSADNNTTTTIYFFWGDGCPHCETQKPFLNSLQEKYGDKIEIKMFETWKTPENVKIFQEVAKAYGVTARGVPATFIGDKNWEGYASYMGSEMETQVKNCIENGCIDLASKVFNPIQEDILKETEIINESEVELKQEKELCIHIFLDYMCQDCDEIETYLSSLEFSNLNIIYHNVDNEIGKELYNSFKDIYGLKVAGYPILFAGDTYLIGYKSITENIQNIIEDCQKKDCLCPADKIKGFSPLMPKQDFKPESNGILNLPLVGEIDLSGMSLFVMTALIAFIDGFNPCSLWVLTFLLGIVIYTGSRKKILIVGLTFLLVTATAYGGFMLGLLNVFKYVGYLTWIKVVVALIALTFAIVNIKDYFWYKKGISFTISDDHKPSFFKKIRNIMSPSQSLGGMILATIIMSLGIVLVELPCTAGFPMIWSNIIAQNNVQGSQFISLFLLYIGIYLLLELIVFFVAVVTLNAGHFEEKHGRILKLVGGIIMLALAITMVFFPDAMNSITGSIYLFGIAGILSYLIIFIHRKILPKFGIKIGTENIKYESNEDNKEENKGDKK